MNESLHNYGAHRNLQGIANIPKNFEKQKPIILLFNAGVVHKVGPFDLNISLTKKFSEEGFLTFRFDLSGMGDSKKIKTGMAHHDETINSLKETMDYCEEHFGSSTFVAVGLCTGADLGHKITCKDERVVGNVWLDGYGYPTTKFNILRYGPILLNPKRLFWVALRLLGLNKSLPNRSVDSYVWKLPPKEHYVNDMEKLKERNVKCLYVFSGGVHEYYNYKDQFQDSFPGKDFLKNITIEYYPKFDHTYVILKDRQVMINRICKWLRASF